MRRIDSLGHLNGLKDFQRASVEYVFRRMYLDPDRTSRFLLADEVGLGKTLVARGVVAKVIDHLWDQVDRIDIVYICSNHDIARQNINRLNVTGDRSAALPSRITMLPVTVRGLKANKLNFVTFTPGTSFHLRSQTGTAEERALLYWMLQDVWDLRGTGPQNLLQAGASKESFRGRLADFGRTYRDGIDRDLQESFRHALDRQAVRERERGEQEISDRFLDLCGRFKYARTHIPAVDAADRSRIIGELRMILAASCLRALEPDLIILDEFQRFKDLLDIDTNNDATLLARHMFDYEDARILLLSATPYKMYTLVDETNEDDHHADFLRTYAFLRNDTGAAMDFARLLREYRQELFRSDGAEGDGLAGLRVRIQSALRKVMVRTERLSATSDRSGMLVQIDRGQVALGEEDVESYVGLAQIAAALKQPDPVEYWKSSPYPLSFMDGYQLKEKLRVGLEEDSQAAALAEVLAGTRGLLLEEESIRRYREIDPGNARLRCLLNDTIGQGQWRRLWMPASLPYYQPDGAFTGGTGESTTKRLVFSSWRLVPKAISCLLSYEAERKMLGLLPGELENTPEARKRRSPLLRFARSDGRLTGMPALGMIYPSFVLAEECDPLRFAAERGGTPLPSLDEVLRWAEGRVEALLRALPPAVVDVGAEDEAWYWATPVLLDYARDSMRAREWFEQERLSALWAGGATDDEGEADGEPSRWDDHVEEARKALLGRLELRARPRDLVHVLALQAIGGPGVTALRAVSRRCGGSSVYRNARIRNAAGSAAWRFLSLFNLPESMALVRHERAVESSRAYWLGTLRYCVDGGLQPVLDEYAHVLHDSLGLFSGDLVGSAEEIARRMAEAVSLRTSRMSADVLAGGRRRNGSPIDNRSMRGRFALRFGQEETDDRGEATHADQVRSAFNSPFWPFVLATTSVGQEGLDFHLYCHAVVHWNLPANPVDLEQREGRVHRYKGYAIRKNLARRYGVPPWDGVGSDPWQALYQRACEEREPGVSDVVPFWVFAVPGGARIERHVPVLPMSRDSEQLSALRRSLAVYRLVFGQARQEELVDYLMRTVPEEEIERVAMGMRFELGPVESEDGDGILETPAGGGL